MFARKPYEDRKEIVQVTWIRFSLRMNRSSSFLRQYYPAHDEVAALMDKLRDYGLYRNEHLDFKEEMDRIRRLKGKIKTHKWSTIGKKKPQAEEDED